MDAKCRRALAGGGCRPGHKRVHDTTRRCGEARKATSTLGSAPTAFSPRAATTTSRIIHRSGSAKPPPMGGAPCGDTRKTTTVTIRLEVPLVRHNRLRVSTLPPAVTTLPGQHTRQPPAYQTDEVCDRTNSGKYKSPIKYRTGRRAKKCGSCEHHGNNNFCLGGSTNEIHAPETQSPSHVAQPRCLFFSYADAVKCRRT